jgi:hypothetical protein
LWKHVLGRGPSLPGRYSGSTLLRPPPTPESGHRRLCVPAGSWCSGSPPVHPRIGSLRFLDESVDARRPLSPRKARLLRELVSSQPMLASPLLEGWPPSWRNEAGLGSLALRLTSSSHRASTAGSPPQPPDRLHGARAFTTASTFQLTRFARLRLTHQKVAKDAKEIFVAFVSFSTLRRLTRQ